ncbi:MAG: hypothetical protein Q9169_006834 [Polycauliona sp. 2 TL-2023]
MDAVAMRVMWAAVRAICADRAIIITTHSMEEASTLSDRTAIVDQRLLTIDTTGELTRRHGDGFYHVHVVLEKSASSTVEEMRRVREWVGERFKGATVQDRLFPDSRGQLRFQITTAANGLMTGTNASESTSSRTEGLKVRDEVMGEGAGISGEGSASTASDQLIEMLDALESAKERLGIGYYTIGQATLEDVFLDVISKNRGL